MWRRVEPAGIGADPRVPRVPSWGSPVSGSVPWATSSQRQVQLLWKLSPNGSPTDRAARCQAPTMSRLGPTAVVFHGCGESHRSTLSQWAASATK